MKSNLNTRDMILISLFAAITAIGAFIRIPLPYIPLTLQFFFCALSGVLLGAKKGAMSQLIYVTIGLLGVPIFTKGGGLQYIFEPTFGYLIGFIIASYTIGSLTYKNNFKITVKKLFFNVICGLFFLYLVGFMHFYIIQNIYLRLDMSFKILFYYGVLKSLPSDLIISFITAMVGFKLITILKKAKFLE